MWFGSSTPEGGGKVTSLKGPYGRGERDIEGKRGFESVDYFIMVRGFLVMFTSKEFFRRNLVGGGWGCT